MSTDEYVPSEAEMMIAWHRHATAEDAKHGRLRDDRESTTKEFVRFMDRVRRDAVERFIGACAEKRDAASPIILRSDGGGLDWSRPLVINGKEMSAEDLPSSAPWRIFPTHQQNEEE